MRGDPPRHEERMPSHSGSLCWNDEEREHWKTYVKTWYPDLKQSFIPEEIFNRVLQLKSEKEELDALNSK